MKTHELRSLGIPKGEILELARTGVQQWVKSAGARITKSTVMAKVADLAKAPENYLEEAHFASAANNLQEIKQAQSSFHPRQEPASYRQWGTDLEAEAIRQMENACQLPFYAGLRPKTPTRFHGWPQPLMSLPSAHLPPTLRPNSRRASLNDQDPPLPD